jgi:MFS family permease
VVIAVPAPLRLPAFRSWWVALQLSNAGTWMQQVAAGWLVYEATHSAAAVGVLSVAQRGPSLFLTPLGGRLADRRDRRDVLAFTLTAQLAAALGLAIVAATGHDSALALIALSFAGGVAQALQYPAQLATISSLVPRQAVHAAVSLNSAGFNLARVVGPAIAGALLVSSSGAVACFALNAVSFCVPLVLTRRLPNASAGARTDGATIRDGISYAMQSPALRRLIVRCAVFAFCAAPLTTLAPAYAAALGGGPGTLGLVLAGFGLGAAIGAAGVVWAGRRFGRHRVIPVGMLAFAIAGFAAALAPDRIAGALLCAMAGVAWLGVFASTNASIQLISPDAIRGRVLSLYLWALVGPMAVAGLLVGILAGPIGVRAALASCSIPLAAYAVFAVARPVPAIDGHADD